MSNLVIDFEEGRADRKVSSFELARYHAGELSAERRREIEALLASDDALRAELDELKASEAAFRVEMPFDRFARDHAARVQSESALKRVSAWLQRNVWQATGGLAAATAAAVVLVMVSVPEGPRGDPAHPEAGIRIKGAARVGFLVQSEGGARFGQDGEQLTEGDRIQLFVKDPAGRSAIVIVGVDGRGQVSVYEAAPIVEGTLKGDDPERARLLERSLVLDDAVGAERFFVVYGTGDVDALRAKVEAAAQRLAAGGGKLDTTERLPLDEGVDQSSVHIVKVAR